MNPSTTVEPAHSRIYLDNAATSWPKPACVYEAIDRYQREIGSPYGRSGYRSAEESQRLVESARRSLAQLVGINDPNHVVFTANGTDSLNTALLGILRPGDHVVTTVCEHNSVLRPLRHLADQAEVEVSYVPCDSVGFVSPEDIRMALRPNTRLVAVNHASNVTGTIQPIAEIGKVAGSCGAYYLVDAAQTLGHVPISMGECQADMLAAPGHKGLLGPFGTGVLCLGDRVLGELEPLRRGGTGSASKNEHQPTELPQKFEAGNLNVLGLAGLTSALDYLQEHGIKAIQNHHQLLTARLLAGLETLPGTTVLGPRADQPRTSVVSINCVGYDPQELAALLEMAAGVECRAGLHCAPRMHQALGTLDSGGTLRLSLGWATTNQEIDRAVAALENVLTIPVG
ncbi:aminotransferase class V-fold PLP-dependent enzyme [Bythopirellula goksoeyrii]|uniref:cysteine desulfurase n=1 Tax=Bythopirellula goksoeyrii TaxID=1400387 RepID=A0A5B9QAH6_9BACT|nr:aminotransferase class V-fold PLP-dependent enzyme [Bythopirellula goksoeyrii]QEG34645.1 putative cysteine desulfurase [Bythopirellula goksoeyrii]